MQKTGGSFVCLRVATGSYASMEGMGLSRKLLGVDEHLVIHVRTHAKALILPSIVLIGVAASTGVGIALMPAAWQPVGPITAIALGLLLVIAWVLVPFLRWRTTTYSVTDRRIITRQGILNQTGHDLPLMRINDVSYRRSLVDRMLGCGTLRIQTAAENGPVILPDVPDVEHVHVQIAELLFSSAGWDAPGDFWHSDEVEDR